MTPKENYIFYTYCLLSFIFVFLTTNYLSLEDIIYKAGQMDVKSYMVIASNSPELTNEKTNLSRHLAQRFLIPYIIGFGSNILNIEIFKFFKLINFIFIFIYLTVIIVYLKLSSFDFWSSLIFYSLLTLNPYIVRGHLFQPIQIHDIIFYTISIIFTICLFRKKYLVLIGINFFSIFLRQTSIAFNIAMFIYFIKNKKIIYLLIQLILLFMSFYLISFFSNFYSIEKFKFNYAYGIVNYDFSNTARLFKFILLPFVSFFPLFIFFYSQIIKNKIIEVENILLLFICLMMIAQPILAGPDGSDRNVVRITTLCYPILLIVFFRIFDLSRFLKNRVAIVIYLIGLHFWSLHPTFSTIKIFDFLRFNLN